MGYWVEYNNMKGIRENLMTDKIGKARKDVMSVVRYMEPQYKAGARIFAGKNAKYPVGRIYFAGGYVGSYIWIPVSSNGRERIPRFLGLDGKIGPQFKY